MEIFGTQQNLVTKIYRGDVNSLNIMLPKNVVALGNSVDIVVRPISGACWKTSYDFTADGVVTKNASAMTKVGTDSNTMKYSIANNVVSFTYQDGESANSVNDSLIAIIYHRNFPEV